jgi:hypothetical protein
MSSLRRDLVLIASIPAEATFGLVGVIVGGVVTGAVEWWAAWRAGRGATRAAVRLVSWELLAISATLEVVAGEMPRDESAEREAADLVREAIRDGPVASAAWSQHQGTLARGLRKPAWRKVGSAYVALQILTLALAAEHEPDDKELLELGRRLWVKVDAALADVKTYA